MIPPRSAIPLTIISGYLGSGKTSLLNHLITRYGTSRFVILVNDFGKLNIDAELVEMEGGRAYRLENGCICCNIGNSLISTLLEVLRREQRPKRILIEASGVANPAQIADIARLSPSLLPGRVIVLVDSEQIRSQLADPLVGETVRKQVEAAELLILNKADLLAEDDLDDLSAWFRSQFGERPLLAARYARVPVTEVFSDRAVSIQAHNNPSQSTRHSEVFWSWSYKSEHFFQRRELEKVLNELAPSLERAKGFVRFCSAPNCTMIVQLSGSKLSITEACQEIPAKLKCRIEFIGVGEMPNGAFLRSIIERAREE